MKHTLAQYLCNANNIHPILVDIGASGDFPAIWNPLKSHAIYVGFDPDLRDIREISDAGFYKAWMVNKVIGSQPGEHSQTFYLTRSPYCSSTLQPDTSVLSNYLFADLFQVESTRDMPSLLLDDALRQLDLTSVHWLKLDSQGTDLRIFNSLQPETRAHLLAVDVEPGILPFYTSEDTFDKLNKELLQQGFWLSQARVLGSVRIHKTVSEKHAPLREGIKRLRSSPGWIEARYLRTVEHLQTTSSPKEDYILLWLFAMLDEQYGFALEVTEGYRLSFAEDDSYRTMHEEVVKVIHSHLPSPALQTVKSIFPRSVKRNIKKYVGRWVGKFRS